MCFFFCRKYIYFFALVGILGVSIATLTIAFKRESGHIIINDVPL